MTAAQYARFSEIRAEMKRYIESMLVERAWILELQRALYRERGYREEDLELPVVYNLALDDVSPESDPRFIVVADNPGLQEQKFKNHRYLVGQSGKLAVSWFRTNLDMDFRIATIIINKTPIHTPKTAELRILTRLAGKWRDNLVSLLEESQRTMARFAIELAECLECPIWVSGIGELGNRGIFQVWAEELRAYAAKSKADTRANILLFRHFSMNQFAIEFSAARREEAARKTASAEAEAEAEAGAEVEAEAEAEAGAAAKGKSGVRADLSDARITLALLKKIGVRNRERILGF